MHASTVAVATWEGNFVCYSFQSQTRTYHTPVDHTNFKTVTMGKKKKTRQGSPANVVMFLEGVKLGKI